MSVEITEHAGRTTPPCMLHVSQYDITPEIDMLDQHGTLVWDAFAAFLADPSYLAEIVEAANLIDYKRRQWGARAEAQKLPVPE